MELLPNYKVSYLQQWPMDSCVLRYTRSYYKSRNSWNHDFHRNLKKNKKTLNWLAGYIHLAFNVDIIWVSVACLLSQSNRSLRTRSRSLCCPRWVVMPSIRYSWYTCNILYPEMSNVPKIWEMSYWHIRSYVLHSSSDTSRRPALSRLCWCSHWLTHQISVTGIELGIFLTSSYNSATDY